MARLALRRKTRFRVLLLDFRFFYFVQPARVLLYSTPQLLARDRHAVAQGAQLGPGDLRGWTEFKGRQEKVRVPFVSPICVLPRLPLNYFKYLEELLLTARVAG